MPSQDLDEIKAALWLQAFHGCTKVRCGHCQVMAVRRRKGQLLALCRSSGHWMPVSGVTIERPKHCPTGACDLDDAPG